MSGKLKNVLNLYGETKNLRNASLILFKPKKTYTVCLVGVRDISKLNLIVSNKNCDICDILNAL